MVLVIWKCTLIFLYGEIWLELWGKFRIVLKVIRTWAVFNYRMLRALCQEVFHCSFGRLSRHLSLDSLARSWPEISDGILLHFGEYRSLEDRLLATLAQRIDVDLSDFRERGWAIIRDVFKTFRSSPDGRKPLFQIFIEEARAYSFHSRRYGWIEDTLLPNMQHTP